MGLCQIVSKLFGFDKLLPKRGTCFSDKLKESVHYKSHFFEFAEYFAILMFIVSVTVVADGLTPK